MPVFAFQDAISKLKEARQPLKTSDFDFDASSGELICHNKDLWIPLLGGEGPGAPHMGHMHGDLDPALHKKIEDAAGGRQVCYATYRKIVT